MKRPDEYSEKLFTAIKNPLERRGFFNKFNLSRLNTCHPFRPYHPYQEQEQQMQELAYQQQCIL